MKTIFFLFIKRKNIIHFVQRGEVPEIRFLLIVRWGESDEAL